MDKCQMQINSQRQRLSDALNEKDALVRQVQQSEARIEELDRTIIEARGIIAGIEFAVKAETERARKINEEAARIRDEVAEERSGDSAAADV